MEWTNELTLEFLNLYEDEPILWNTTLAEHKNKLEVYEAWVRIKSKLRNGIIPLKELKKKRESLMATYRAAKGKISKSMKIGRIYTPQWPFYKVMANFLDNVYKPRNSKFVAEVFQIPESDEEFQVKIETNEVSNDANTDHFESKETDWDPLDLVPIKRMKEDNIDDTIDDTIADTPDCNESCASTKQSEIPRKDISALYCVLLAEKMRGLKENTRDLAMLEIDKLLYNLKQLDNRN